MLITAVVMLVTASDDVDQSDYEKLTQEVNALIKAWGSISMLLDMTDFKGEKAEAWKSDIDFAKEFGGNIDKMAIVGNKQWESMMTKAAGSHYANQAKYFDGDSMSSAWQWLRQ